MFSFVFLFPEEDFILVRRYMGNTREGKHILKKKQKQETELTAMKTTHTKLNRKQ